jgi:hypothetical protein
LLSIPGAERRRRAPLADARYLPSLENATALTFYWAPDGSGLYIPEAKLSVGNSKVRSVRGKRDSVNTRALGSKQATFTRSVLNQKLSSRIGNSQGTGLTDSERGSDVRKVFQEHVVPTTAS